MDLKKIEEDLEQAKTHNLPYLFIQRDIAGEWLSLTRKQEDALVEANASLMEQTEIAQAANRQAEECKAKLIVREAELTDLRLQYLSDFGQLQDAVPQQHAQAAQPYKLQAYLDASQEIDAATDNLYGQAPAQPIAAELPELSDEQIIGAILATRQPAPAVSQQGAELCMACDGHGAREDDPGEWSECPVCKGYGIAVGRSPADAAPVDEADLECQVPPHGWRCTRGAGHDGPCAAVECPEDILAVADGMKRLAAQPSPAPADAVPAQTGMQGEARTAFEVWAKDHGFDVMIGPDGERYMSGFTQGVWEPWQAALAQRAASKDSERDAALKEVDAVLELIVKMQDDDWPGQGAPSSELARHWFAAYGRCTNRAKEARNLLSAMAAQQGEKG